ncbi:MAG: helix-turn-helix domain-containing protein [Oscillochloridaceae bacterium umkhey_bin13]
MSELGARLREARERQGLSLAQAASDTRILQSSLVALEEGAYQRLPGDVVIRGFIRNYAQYLGLAADELIESYRRERGVTDQIRIVPATIPPRTRSYVLPSFFGVFIVTVALVGMTYITLNAVGRLGDRTEAAAATITATVPPPPPLPTATAGLAPTIPVPTRTMPTASTLQPGAAGGIVPTTEPVEPNRPTPAPEAPIVLELRIPNARGNENSWVRVQADGNTIYEGIMRAGETRSFTAQRRVIVRAGNPPDVLVTVNGLQQGSVGQNAGQPVNWSWPPN